MGIGASDASEPTSDRLMTGIPVPVRGAALGPDVDKINLFHPYLKATLVDATFLFPPTARAEITLSTASCT